MLSVLVFVFFVGMGVAFADATQPVQERSQPDLTAEEQAFFDLINAHRKSIGAPPLTPDPNLMFGARRWSTKHGYGHASHGFNGECLAPYGTATDAFNCWLNSPRHKRIMEGSAFYYAGIGFNRGRAVLRTSIKPWTYQDTTSTPTYKVRSSVFRGLFTGKAYSRTRVRINR
jgi:uncharacterized protein YkwD